MVGVRVPLVIESRKGSLKNSESLFSQRRGSGVQGVTKPLLKKNSRSALLKKNSKPKIKTFQVAIQLEGDNCPDLKKPQFTKRRSLAKICLKDNENREAPSLPKGGGPLSRKSGVLRVTKEEQVEEQLCAERLRNISLKDTFHTQALHLHNTYRAKHHVQKLVLNDELSLVAQKYADFLADTNTFEHSGDQEYGENLYWGWSSDPKWHLEASEVVSSWYEEGNGYDYLGEPRDTESGHFTQLVWSQSQLLGVGLAKSKKTGRYICVMKYYPPGNYLGNYVENVTPPEKNAEKQR